MLDDFKKEIQDRINDLQSAKEVLEFLGTEVSKLARIRAEVDQELQYYNPAVNALERIREQANATLWKAASEAIELTKEFNLPMYVSKFKKAVFDKRTITLTAKLSTLTVEANLDLTAGSLEEYANAINKAREAQNRKSKLKDSTLVSHFWEEKYYKPAREGTSFTHPKGRKVKISRYKEAYWKTIRLRRSFFGSLAPFWELIDKGNEDTRLLSDHEMRGEPYPKYGATDFIEKAVKRIKFLFLKTHNDSSKQQQELYKALGQVEDELNYVLALQRKIAGGDVQSILRAQLQKQLKAKFPLADPVRLRKLMNDVLAGNPTKTKTDVGTSYRNRIQVRTKYIQRLIQRFYGR